MKIVMTGVTWVLLSYLHGRIFEFRAYDILAWIEQDGFWMMSHHLFFDWKSDVFFFDYCVVTDVIWTWKYFLQSWKDALRIGYPYNVAMWVDEMPCRKGVWKLITLWVRVTSDMPFLIVVATCLIVVQSYARKMSRQHSMCCWRDLCSRPAIWSQYSIGHWVCNLLRHSEVSYQC
jgi:hypothetical protein